MEAERFDRSMARYEAAATKTWTSLGWLNFGQGVIFGVGMTIVMWLSAREVMAGTQTVGDFVFVNAMLMQLSQPLNFIGMIYREIRQGLTDIEQMFDLLDVQAGGARPAGRQAARRQRGQGRVPRRALRLRPGPPDPEGRELRGAGRQDGRDRRPVRRRQVDDLAAAVPLLRHPARRDPDRRPGHPRRDAGKPARGARHGAAGHGAVQRHHRLQHPLRPPRRRAGGGDARGRPGADRRRSSPSCPTATAPWSASAG